MKRTTLFLLALLAAACGEDNTLLPDGGARPDAAVPQDGGSNPGDSGTLVAEIRVEPDPELFCPFGCLELSEGDTVQLVAIVLDAAGGVLNREVTWTTATATVAFVDEDGLVNAVSHGMVAIRASAEGVEGEAIITVTRAPISLIVIEPAEVLLPAIGGTQVLVARAYDSFGTEITTDFEWTSGNPQVATVENGTVTGVGRGATVIYASTLTAVGYAKVVVISEISEQPGLQATSYSAGVAHACAASDAGAWCWGWNFFGQLGNADRGRQDERFPRALPVVDGSRFERVFVGDFHTCALTEALVPWCWGLNGTGQLGLADPGIGGTLIPMEVQGGHTFTAMEAGGDHTCALAPDSDAWCWGLNHTGQLGIDNTTDQRAPTRVVGGHRFDSIAAGLENTCALSVDGTAYCWGGNSMGQLGNGGLGDHSRSLVPSPVTGNLVFTQLDGESNHTCGVALDQSVHCWGRNDSGELGDGSFEHRGAPMRVPSEIRFSQVTTGTHHTCALDVDGQAWCWGHNGSGQLGSGDLEDSVTPVRVLGELRFRTLDAGGGQTCGADAEGRLYCWGSAYYGELGAGDPETLLSVVPWPVALPL